MVAETVRVKWGVCGFVGHVCSDVGTSVNGILVLAKDEEYMTTETSLLSP